MHQECVRYYKKKHVFFHKYINRYGYLLVNGSRYIEKQFYQVANQISVTNPQFKLKAYTLHDKISTLSLG